MAVKLGLPPVQSKEGLGLLETKFGGQYVDQPMIASMQLGEENITKNYKTNWELHQLGQRIQWLTYHQLTYYDY